MPDNLYLTDLDALNRIYRLSKELCESARWELYNIRDLKKAIKEAERGIVGLEMRANQQLIEVTDEDSFSLVGYRLKVHENGMAGTIKATLFLGSDHQLKALVRTLLEACMELDPEKVTDWVCLNLSWIIER